MKARANDLTIWWNDEAVAYATTAEVDVSADTYEVGSATSGAWRKHKSGRKGWTLSAGYLADTRTKRETGQPNPFQMLKNGAEVPVVFGTMERLNGEPVEAVDQAMSYDWYYSGKVIVNRATVSAVKGQFATRQFSAIGSGELKEYRRVSEVSILEVLKTAWYNETGKGLIMSRTFGAQTMTAPSAKMMLEINGALGTTLTWDDIRTKLPEAAATYIHGIEPVEEV